MSTKIITVATSPPAESSGADYNKGAALNATEFDQNLVNLRAAIDRRALSSSSNAFTCGALSAALITASSGIKPGNVAGADANTLDWYEEMTDFTPTATSVTLTKTSARYTRIGSLVTVMLDVTWPTTADTSDAKIAGMPVLPATYSGAASIGFSTLGTADCRATVVPATGIMFYDSSGGVKSNAFMSGKRVVITATYTV